MMKYFYTLLSFKKNILSCFNYFSFSPFNNYRKVYHLHLMKTGGTSLNHMFLALSKKENEPPLYDKLLQTKDLRLIVGRYVYSCWNRLIINFGFFHYAFSHDPYWQLNHSNLGFIITTIRHPYERIYSRYLHVLRESTKKYPRDDILDQISLLGDNFSDYLSNISKEEMCHQLFMYSKKMNLKEGIKNIKKINYVLYLNTFEEDVNNLNNIFGCNLKVQHVRKATKQEIDLDRFFEKHLHEIQPELDFYFKVLEIRNEINQIRRK